MLQQPHPHRPMTPSCWIWNFLSPTPFCPHNTWQLSQNTRPYQHLDGPLVNSIIRPSITRWTVHISSRNPRPSFHSRFISTSKNSKTKKPQPQRAHPKFTRLPSTPSSHKYPKYPFDPLVLLHLPLSSQNQPTKTLSFSSLIDLFFFFSWFDSSIMRRPKASKKTASAEKKKKKGANSTSPEELPKESTKASSSGKRVKAPAALKPQEDEILPDKRNMVRFQT